MTEDTNQTNPQFETKALRMLAFGAAMRINEEGHGDLAFVLQDAREIEAYLSGAAATPVEQAQPLAGEDLPDMGDPDPVTAFGEAGGAMVATGDKVVPFPMAETVAAAGPAPETAAAPTRKMRGPKKAKAAKKARAKREKAIEPIDDSIPHMEPSAAVTEPAASPQETAPEQPSLAA